MVSVMLFSWLAAVAGLAWAQDFDTERYPQSSVEAVVKANPCRAGSNGYDVKDVLFRLRAEFRNETRAAGKGRWELLKRWAAKINAPEQAEKFSRELRLGRGDSALWALVTREMLEGMRKDLQSGDTTWFYLTFIGCSGQDPAFAVDEFEVIDYDDLDDRATSYIT